MVPIRMQRILPALLITLGCTPLAAPLPPQFGDISVFAGKEDVGVSSLLKQAESSALVCIGEQHDNAEHHQVQSQLFDSLGDQARRRGTHIALGMEMFRRHMQPALNAFHDGEIDVEELKTATDWEKSWGYDFAMYRPLLESARHLGVRIIGLNAPRELTRAVARRGIKGLPALVRESLPELVLDDVGHRKFFWTIMGFEQHDSGKHGSGKHGSGHSAKGHGAMSPENFYAAQVIWDETMAESASAWLSDPEPRQMVIVAGNGHCHKSAVPNRVARRHHRPAMSILLRTQGDELPAHAQSDFVIEVR